MEKITFVHNSEGSSVHPYLLATSSRLPEVAAVAAHYSVPWNGAKHLDFFPNGCGQGSLKEFIVIEILPFYSGIIIYQPINVETTHFTLYDIT